MTKGNAAAQAISHWLPTPEARVRSCGIYGGQIDTSVGFLQVLRCQLSSIMIQGWYNRSFSGHSNSGFGSLPPQETKKKKPLMKNTLMNSYKVKCV
jgi:hypothetical protein